jgi:hypothetical protein
MRNCSNSGKKIQVGDSTLCYETHKVVDSVWNKEDLQEQWKEFVLVPIYRRSDKMDCSYF